ncbi:hypothetical protein C5B94_03935 [Clavibacter michiganensis]|uniref:hypothetical protein n=1 Tax=Clavibacter michiganensis TaxID=28447 RepID=UPI000CE74778|nr:hypothetical protein [Clavibacter michiganensis]PPF56079.1 hypothetical protein C5B94_03935 [Clavibacter michiganensis]
MDFTLPRGGRKGAAPAWPITGVRRPATWAELWKTPQSAAWEELGINRTVARYALLLQQAERPGALASIQNEVRQLEDRLGLTPMAMLRLHWELSADEVGAQRSTAKQDDTTTASRARLKIVG